jgi:hypothetical protein
MGQTMVRLRSQHEREESARDHLCFDTHLMWVKAVIDHYHTYETAYTQWISKRTDTSGTLEERLRRLDEARELFHVMTRARHDMLSAAQQFFLSRNWALKRKLVEEDIFRDIDQFRNDVAILRNMHQHQIEYFKGEGQKPEHWEFRGDAWSADASSTVDGLWGGRLDPKMLCEAAEKLLPVLIPLDPEIIERQKMSARNQLRDIKRRLRREITDEDISSISAGTGLSNDSVREQLSEVQAEDRTTGSDPPPALTGS